MITKPDFWPGLELRHLAALQAVAEEGSFWNAADRLDASQSSVSQQIATLERIVGERLVERSRGRKPVTLTEAGQLLLRHGEAIVARLRAAHADFAAFADGAAGVLRVGTYQSVGYRILPAVVREFATAWPGIEVRLIEEQTDARLLSMVERGELDMTFATHPLSRGPFEAIELMHDPVVLVVPAGFPLAHRDRAPTPRDLGGLRLIASRSCTTSGLVEEHLRSRGVQPRVVFRSDDNGTVQAMVAAGFGVALTYRLAVDERDAAVRVLQPGFAIPPRILLLAWHGDRYRTPAARAFVETARSAAAALDVRSSGPSTARVLPTR